MMSELSLAFAPVPPKDKIPATDLATYLVLPWDSNDSEEAATRKEKENDATCACPRIFSSLLYLL